MDDPFARLDAATARTMGAAYQAVRDKKYEEAILGFAAVVQALPGDSTARFQQLRALALAGRFAAIPETWRQLLARDFVAYAGHLDKPALFAPLRASAVWPQLRHIEEALRPAYAAGLATGGIFLARTHVRALPRLDGPGVAKLQLSQEVFHTIRSRGAPGRRTRRAPATRAR